MSQQETATAKAAMLWGKAIGDSHDTMTANELARFPSDDYQHELIKGLLLRMPPPQTVLGPDVSYIAPGHAGERMEAYERIAPDLVVEVASPSQYRPEMVNKTQMYLNAGVRLVWVIWPNAQIVEVWEADGVPKTLAERIGMAANATLTISDMLDGREVLPGFTMPVKDLFEL